MSVRQPGLQCTFCFALINFVVNMVLISTTFSGYKPAKWSHRLQNSRCCLFYSCSCSSPCAHITQTKRSYERGNAVMTNSRSTMWIHCMCNSSEEETLHLITVPPQQALSKTSTQPLILIKVCVHMTNGMSSFSANMDAWASVGHGRLGFQIFSHFFAFFLSHTLYNRR